MNKYSRWEDIPSNLKTKTALKQMGLKLKRGQKPVAVKTSSYYKIPDYYLYEVSEAVSNVVSDKQKAAIEKAKAASLEKRTCTRCGYVEELSRDYRNKHHVFGGFCERCWEYIEHENDQAEASEWAWGILQREDVLILDSETTDLNGEIIELAIINLKGDLVFNQRFKPLTPVSEGARAKHGISDEMLANEKPFTDYSRDLLIMLSTAGLVLIYNAAFDMARLRQTCKLHGELMPSINADCIMEWYAQWCGQWSHYHKSYRWQPLGGGDHSALGDCRAALDCIREMARQNDSDNPPSVT